MHQSTRLTRRHALRLGGIGALAALVTACGGAAAPTAAPTAAPPKPADKPADKPAAAATKPAAAATKPAAAATKPAVAPAAGSAPAKGATNLVFWRYASQTQDEAVADLIKRFTAENPGLSIEQAFFGGDYRQKILAAVAAKTQPDFMFCDGPWLPEFGTRNLLDPAPPEVVEDLRTNWTKGGQAYVTYKGVQYGYPWENSIHQLFLNDELFEKAGLDPKKPPYKSFTEFREAAKKLAKVEGGTLTQAGFLGNQRIFYVANFLYNNDATIMNEDAEGNLQQPVKGMLAEPKALEVWQLLYDMYNTDKSASAKLPPATDSFAQGKVAMVVTGNFFINTLKVNAPNIRYSISPQPSNLQTPVAQLGGWVSVVMRDSSPDKKATAWKFNRWINTKENILFTESKFAWMTTRTDAIADPKVRVLEPEKLKPFYDVMPTISRVRPKSTAYEQIEQALNPITQRLFLGEINAKQAADEANKKVDELIKADQKP